MYEQAAETAAAMVKIFKNSSFLEARHSSVRSRSPCTYQKAAGEREVVLIVLPQESSGFMVREQRSNAEILLFVDQNSYSVTERT
jgi:hypothetical protein